MSRIRFKCWLRGCETDDESYWGVTCFHCDAGIYDPEFYQSGFLWRVLWSRPLISDLRHSLSAVIHAFHNRCGYCGKHLWFQSYGFCNQECEQKWIPF